MHNRPRAFFFRKKQNNQKTNIMKIIDYIKDTKGELKHVSWSTRRQAIVYTIIVILISVSVALFLGFFDFIFTETLEKFVL
jgi:preprotein translocase subunit SecE